MVQSAICNIPYIAFKINVMHYGRWGLSRAIGNLVGIVFSPSNTIMHYDKIKSDMVYYLFDEYFIKAKI